MGDNRLSVASMHPVPGLQPTQAPCPGSCSQPPHGTLRTPFLSRAAPMGVPHSQQASTQSTLVGMWPKSRETVMTRLWTHVYGLLGGRTLVVTLFQ